MDVADLSHRTIAVLRSAGACFAYVHGSRASGRARPDSDLGVAAFWGTTTPPAAMGGVSAE